MRSNPIHSLQAKRRSDEGFTLIELLVVVVILGILIGIAIPVYLNYRKSANDKAAQSDVRNAVATMELCNSDASSYPLSVPAGGGTMTTAANGCTQSVAVSTNTTLRYVASSTTAPVASYTIYGTNSGGSPKIYCYSSTAGGAIKEATGTALATATC